MTKLYTEEVSKSDRARESYYDGISALCERGFSCCNDLPSASALRKALGAPLSKRIPESLSVSQEFVGRDELCEIFRLRFLPFLGVPFYGLLFVPHGAKGKSPLIVAAHGHLGTPELMYGMHGKNGYGNLIARLVSKNVCVFAPQFLLWNCGMSPAKPIYKTKYDRVEIDKKLKEKGGSITALEVFFLLRAIATLSKMNFIDSEKVGVSGMSYGAFLTLRAMAVSKKIKCGYFMSCSNGSIDVRFPEWFFPNPEETLRDSQFLSLCAPRRVFVEVGRFDDIFPVEGAIAEAEAAAESFVKHGAKENFRFSIWDGGHVVNPENDGIDFLLKSFS